MKIRDDKRSPLSVTLIIVAVLGVMALSEISFAHREGSTLAKGLVQPLQPACVVRDTAGKAALGNNDPLAKLLTPGGGPCPSNVFEFRARLLGAGAKIKTAFVANRGVHNPTFGSFSMFEIVSGRLAPAGIEVADGEFFFGHFTARDGNRLFANQAPGKKLLMIELIAWDPQKQLFNFYEVIGDGQRGQ